MPPTYWTDWGSGGSVKWSLPADARFPWRRGRLACAKAPCGLAAGMSPARRFSSAQGELPQRLGSACRRPPATQPFALVSDRRSRRLGQTESSAGRGGHPAVALWSVEMQVSGRELMISEASGATPVGIFLLGDGFLDAARDTAKTHRKMTDGPTRLLCYHACELFLKAFLRERGEDMDVLRAYGHDLGKMLESAKAKGLLPSRQAQRAITGVVGQNDYVRVRYMVVETEEDLPIDEVLRLAERVRKAVRHALGLDEFGMPLLPKR